MARLKATIELDLPPPSALAACAEAFAGLGWRVSSRSPSALRASEDFTRLHCHQWPAEAELRVGAADSGGASVAIETIVPGRGPIASVHARDCSRAFALRLQALTSRSDGG